MEYGIPISIIANVQITRFPFSYVPMSHYGDWTSHFYDNLDREMNFSYLKLGRVA